MMYRPILSEMTPPYVAPVIEKPITELDRLLYKWKEIGYPGPEPGLRLVNPEYDILTFARSLATLPGGFLKGLGRVPMKSENFYRQVGRDTKAIEDAMKSGVISVKSATTKKNPGKISIMSKTFNVPFFKQGSTWYPYNSKFDIVVGRNGNGVQFVPINAHGTFIKTAPGKILERATPLFKGVPNKAPSSLFTFYRYYPIIGYRNVTNGFPTIPITGLDFVKHVNDLEE